LLKINLNRKLYEKCNQIISDVTAVLSFAFVKPTHSESKQIHVVIDTPRGGSDFGATFEGANEKRIGEQITHKIKFLNKNKNVVIHLTRSEDKFISLNERTDFINSIKPDLLVSLHLNAISNKNTSSVKFYVSKESKSY
jgi:N-acetylmuramoyl-L-alanine amidase